MDPRRRYTLLLRPNFACMALSLPSNGQGHVAQMAESWLPGELSVPCDRRRNAPRRYHFTRRSEYDARWVGTTPRLPLLKDEQSGKARESEPGEICGRLRHYGKLAGATGTGSQAPRGAIHEGTRTGTLP